MGKRRKVPLRTLTLLAFVGGILFLINSTRAEEKTTEPCGKKRTKVIDEWIDETTGHRVIRLSRRPGPNYIIYFHDKAFTDTGDKMLFKGQDQKIGASALYTVDMKTLKVETITNYEGDHVVLAPKRREVFYMEDNVFYATHLDTKKTRQVVKLPKDFPGHPRTINADENVVAGVYADGLEPFLKPFKFVEIFEAKLPNHLFTIDLETGKLNEFHHENTWLGHVQFSPTDPTLIMFCHEGPWHRVDRIWLIRSDGTNIRQIHKRTVDGEIAGHEFFSPDGKNIWFDLQIPGSGIYLAGYNIETGKEIRYELTRDQWCMHYNISLDGKMFCGDGGGEDFVAKAKNGKWIYLFRPEGDKLNVKRLCNMSAHKYTYDATVQPNTRFTPDGKWIVFSGNMHGVNHIYAVEIEPAKTLKLSK